MFEKITHIFYDFDGVMTDNTAYMSEDGKELVRVNRSDGYAVSKLHELGYIQIIMSTEKNDVVSMRAKKLKLPCYYGIQDKKEKLEFFLKENEFAPECIAFVGNDLNDLGVMQLAGLSICPSDSHPTIREIADITLQTKGGNGAIRELLELIIIKEN
jgi:YrbI family 3-deoxy-D-manno-octulosonate 8-phosphate phosphatase